jgi:hypothetical protein
MVPVSWLPSRHLREQEAQGLCQQQHAHAPRKGGIIAAHAFTRCLRDECSLRRTVSEGL